MAAKNPKAYFPGCIAKISFKPVDKWARIQAERHPNLYPYFSTWNAAHDHMVRDALAKLEHSEKDLVSRRKHLSAVLAMKNPDSPQEASDASN